MLESWLAPLLMQLLGDYVKPECFDSNSVHLSVWGGYCALSNLELKPEALDVLQLPVALKRGFIGRIEFQLPWGTPGTKPTVVKIDEVYLLLETKYEWIGARAEARSRAATRSKLEHVTAAQARVAELRAKRVALRELRAAARATAAPQTSSGKTGAAVGGDPGDDDSSGDDEDVDAALAAATAANGAAASLAAVRSAAPGFIEKLFTKLLDNLQLHVRGVHIRWEDSCSLPMPRSAGGGTAAHNLAGRCRPFAAGLTLESLHVQSTDAAGRPLFGDGVGSGAPQARAGVRQAGSSLAAAVGSVAGAFGLSFGAGSASQPHPHASASSAASRIVHKAVHVVHFASYLAFLDDGGSASGDAATKRGNGRRGASAADTSTGVAARDDGERHDGQQQRRRTQQRVGDAQRRGSSSQGDEQTTQAVEPKRASAAENTNAASMATASSRVHNAAAAAQPQRPRHSLQQLQPPNVDLGTCELAVFRSQFESLIPRSSQTTTAHIMLRDPRLQSQVAVGGAVRGVPRISTSTSTFDGSSVGDAATSRVLITTPASAAGSAELRAPAPTASSDEVSSAAAASAVPIVVTGATSTQPTRGRANQQSSRASSSTIEADVDPASYLFEALPSSRALPAGHALRDSLLLLPLDGRLRIALSRNAASTAQPQTAVEVALPRVALQLQSVQYGALVSVAAGFAAYKIRRRFDHLRPSQRLIVWPRRNDRPHPRSVAAPADAPAVEPPQGLRSGASEMPAMDALDEPHCDAARSTGDATRSRIARAWWRYAVLAVLEQIAGDAYSSARSAVFLRWNVVARRQAVRRAYVTLYSRAAAASDPATAGATVPSVTWPAARIRALQSFLSGDHWGTNTTGDDEHGPHSEHGATTLAEVGGVDVGAAARAAPKRRRGGEQSRGRRARRSQPQGQLQQRAEPLQSTEPSDVRGAGAAVLADALLDTPRGDATSHAVTRLQRDTRDGIAAFSDASQGSPTLAAMRKRRRSTAADAESAKSSATSERPESSDGRPTPRRQRSASLTALHMSREVAACARLREASEAAALKRVLHRSLFRSPWSGWARRFKVAYTDAVTAAAKLAVTSEGTDADVDDSAGVADVSSAPNVVHDGYAASDTEVQWDAVDDMLREELPSSSPLPLVKLNQHEEQLLAALEDRLPAPDILLFRAIAAAQSRRTTFLAPTEVTQTPRASSFASVQVVAVVPSSSPGQASASVTERIHKVKTDRGSGVERLSPGAAVTAAASPVSQVEHEATRRHRRKSRVTLDIDEVRGAEDVRGTGEDIAAAFKRNRSDPKSVAPRLKSAASLQVEEAGRTPPQRQSSQGLLLHPADAGGAVGTVGAVNDDTSSNGAVGESTVPLAWPRHRHPRRRRSHREVAVVRTADGVPTARRNSASGASTSGDMHTQAMSPASGADHASSNIDTSDRMAARQAADPRRRRTEHPLSNTLEPLPWVAQPTAVDGGGDSSDDSSTGFRRPYSSSVDGSTPQGSPSLAAPSNGLAHRQTARKRVRHRGVDADCSESSSDADVGARDARANMSRPSATPLQHFDDASELVSIDDDIDDDEPPPIPPPAVPSGGFVSRWLNFSWLWNGNPEGLSGGTSVPSVLPPAIEAPQLHPQVQQYERLAGLPGMDALPAPPTAGVGASPFPLGAQRREIFAAVDYDPVAALDGNMYPRSYTVTRVDVRISEASLTLARVGGVQSRSLSDEVHDAASLQAIHPLLHVVAINFNFDYALRPSSLRASASLGHVAVHDLARHCASVFSLVVGPKLKVMTASAGRGSSASLFTSQTQLQHLHDGADARTIGGATASSEREAHHLQLQLSAHPLPMFYFVYETFPPDSAAAAPQVGASVTAGTTFVGTRPVASPALREGDTAASESPSDAELPQPPAASRAGGVVNASRKSVAAAPPGATLDGMSRSGRKSSTRRRGGSSRRSTAVDGASSVHSAGPKRDFHETSLRGAVLPNATSAAAAEFDASARQPRHGGSVGGTSGIGSTGGGAAATSLPPGHAGVAGVGPRRYRRPQWTIGADFALTLHMQPLEIVVAQAVGDESGGITGCVRFFENPMPSAIGGLARRRPGEVDSSAAAPGVAALAAAASAQLQTLRYTALSLLAAAYTRRLAIAVDVRIIEPVVLIPTDVMDPASTMIVLDCGTIRAKSRELRSKQTISALAMSASSAGAPIQHTAATAAPDGPTTIAETAAVDLPPAADWRALYDIYHARLSHGAVLLTRACTPWRDASAVRRRGLALVSDLRCSVDAYVSILQDDIAYNAIPQLMVRDATTSNDPASEVPVVTAGMGSADVGASVVGGDATTSPVNLYPPEDIRTRGAAASTAKASPRARLRFEVNLHPMRVRITSAQIPFLVEWGAALAEVMASRKGSTGRQSSIGPSVIPSAVNVPLPSRIAAALQNVIPSFADAVDSRTLRYGRGLEVGALRGGTAGYATADSIGPGRAVRQMQVLPNSPVVSGAAGLAATPSFYNLNAASGYHSSTTKADSHALSTRHGMGPISTRGGVLTTDADAPPPPFAALLRPAHALRPSLSAAQPKSIPPPPSHDGTWHSDDVSALAATTAATARLQMSLYAYQSSRASRREAVFSSSTDASASVAHIRPTHLSRPGSRAAVPSSPSMIAVATAESATDAGGTGWSTPTGGVRQRRRRAIRHLEDAARVLPPPTPIVATNARSMAAEGRSLAGRTWTATPVIATARVAREAANLPVPASPALIPANGTSLGNASEPQRQVSAHPLAMDIARGELITASDMETAAARVEILVESFTIELVGGSVAMLESQWAVAQTASHTPPPANVELVAIRASRSKLRYDSRYGETLCSLSLAEFTIDDLSPDCVTSGLAHLLKTTRVSDPLAATTMIGTDSTAPGTANAAVLGTGMPTAPSQVPQLLRFVYRNTRRSVAVPPPAFFLTASQVGSEELPYQDTTLSTRRESTVTTPQQEAVPLVLVAPRLSPHDECAESEIDVDVVVAGVAISLNEDTLASVLRYFGNAWVAAQHQLRQRRGPLHIDAMSTGELSTDPGVGEDEAEHSAAGDASTQVDRRDDVAVAAHDASWLCVGNGNSLRAQLLAPRVIVPATDTTAAIVRIPYVRTSARLSLRVSYLYLQLHNRDSLVLDAEMRDIGVSARATAVRARLLTAIPAFTASSRALASHDDGSVGPVNDASSSRNSARAGDSGAGGWASGLASDFNLDVAAHSVPLRQRRPSAAVGGAARDQESAKNHTQRQQDHVATVQATTVTSAAASRNEDNAPAVIEHAQASSLHPAPASLRVFVPHSDYDDGCVACTLDTVTYDSPAGETHSVTRDSPRPDSTQQLNAEAIPAYPFGGTPRRRSLRRRPLALQRQQPLVLQWHVIALRDSGAMRTGMSRETRDTVAAHELTSSHTSVIVQTVAVHDRWGERADREGREDVQPLRHKHDAVANPGLTKISSALDIALQNPDGVKGAASLQTAATVHPRCNILVSRPVTVASGNRSEVELRVTDAPAMLQLTYATAPAMMMQRGVDGCNGDTTPLDAVAPPPASFSIVSGAIAGDMFALPIIDAAGATDTAFDTQAGGTSSQNSSLTVGLASPSDELLSQLPRRCALLRCHVRNNLMVLDATTLSRIFAHVTRSPLLRQATMLRESFSAHHEPSGSARGAGRKQNTAMPAHDRVLRRLYVEVVNSVIELPQCVDTSATVESSNNVPETTVTLPRRAGMLLDLGSVSLGNAVILARLPKPTDAPDDDRMRVSGDAPKRDVRDQIRLPCWTERVQVSASSLCLTVTAPGDGSIVGNETQDVIHNLPHSRQRRLHDVVRDFSLRAQYDTAYCGASVRTAAAADMYTPEDKIAVTVADARQAPNATTAHITTPRRQRVVETERPQLPLVGIGSPPPPVRNRGPIRPFIARSNLVAATQHTAAAIAAASSAPVSARHLLQHERAPARSLSPGAGIASSRVTAIGADKDAVVPVHHVVASRVLVQFASVAFTLSPQYVAAIAVIVSSNAMRLRTLMPSVNVPVAATISASGGDVDSGGADKVQPHYDASLPPLVPPTDHTEGIDAVVHRDRAIFVHVACPRLALVILRDEPAAAHDNSDLSPLCTAALSALNVSFVAQDARSHNATRTLAIGTQQSTHQQRDLELRAASVSCGAATVRDERLDRTSLHEYVVCPRETTTIAGDVGAPVEHVQNSGPITTAPFLAVSYELVTDPLAISAHVGAAHMHQHVVRLDARAPRVLVVPQLLSALLESVATTTHLLARPQSTLPVVAPLSVDQPAVPASLVESQLPLHVTLSLQHMEAWFFEDATSSTCNAVVVRAAVLGGTYSTAPPANPTPTASVGERDGRNNNVVTQFEGSVGDVDITASLTGLEVSLYGRSHDASAAAVPVQSDEHVRAESGMPFFLPHVRRRIELVLPFNGRIAVTRHALALHLGDAIAATSAVYKPRQETARRLRGGFLTSIVEYNAAAAAVAGLASRDDSVPQKIGGRTPPVGDHTPLVSALEAVPPTQHDADAKVLPARPPQISRVYSIDASLTAVTVCMSQSELDAIRAIAAALARLPTLARAQPPRPMGGPTPTALPQSSGQPTLLDLPPPPCAIMNLRQLAGGARAVLVSRWPGSLQTTPLVSFELHGLAMQATADPTRLGVEATGTVKLLTASSTADGIVWEPALTMAPLSVSLAGDRVRLQPQYAPRAVPQRVVDDADAMSSAARWVSRLRSALSGVVGGSRTAAWGTDSIDGPTDRLRPGGLVSNPSRRLSPSASIALRPPPTGVDSLAATSAAIVVSFRSFNPVRVVASTAGVAVLGRARTLLDAAVHRSTEVAKQQSLAALTCEAESYWLRNDTGCHLAYNVPRQIGAYWAGDMRVTPSSPSLLRVQLPPSGSTFVPLVATAEGVAWPGDVGRENSVSSGVSLDLLVGDIVPTAFVEQLRDEQTAPFSNATESFVQLDRFLAEGSTVHPLRCAKGPRSQGASLRATSARDTRPVLIVADITVAPSGLRRIVLRSTLIVTNRLMHPILITATVPDNGSASHEAVWRLWLPPGHASYVPATLAVRTDVTFFVEAAAVGSSSKRYNNQSKCSNVAVDEAKSVRGYAILGGSIGCDSRPGHRLVPPPDADSTAHSSHRSRGGAGDVAWIWEAMLPQCVALQGDVPTPGVSPADQATRVSPAVVAFRTGAAAHAEAARSCMLLPRSTAAHSCAEHCDQCDGQKDENTAVTTAQSRLRHMATTSSFRQGSMPNHGWLRVVSFHTPVVVTNWLPRTISVRVQPISAVLDDRHPTYDTLHAPSATMNIQPGGVRCTMLSPDPMRPVTATLTSAFRVHVAVGGMQGESAGFVLLPTGWAVRQRGYYFLSRDHDSREVLVSTPASPGNTSLSSVLLRSASSGSASVYGTGTMPSNTAASSHSHRLAVPLGDTQLQHGVDAVYCTSMWLRTADTSGLILEFGVDVRLSRSGTTRIEVYAPICIFNRTGLPFVFEQRWDEPAVPALAGMLQPGVVQPLIERTVDAPAQYAAAITASSAAPANAFTTSTAASPTTDAADDAGFRAVDRIRRYLNRFYGGGATITAPAAARFDLARASFETMTPVRDNELIKSRHFSVVAGVMSCGYSHPPARQDADAMASSNALPTITWWRDVLPLGPGPLRMSHTAELSQAGAATRITDWALGLRWPFAAPGASLPRGRWWAPHGSRVPTCPSAYHAAA